MDLSMTEKQQNQCVFLRRPHTYIIDTDVNDTYNVLHIPQLWNSSFGNSSETSGGSIAFG